MPRHPPIALKTLDRSHCQCSPAQSRRNCRFSQTLASSASAQSKGLHLNQILCGTQFDVIGTKRPASRDRFEGAVRQTHHMREIERLPRQIMNLSDHEVRTNLLFTMSNRTSGELDAHHKPFIRMTFFSHLHSTPPRDPQDRREPRQSLRDCAKWWSRTGSNRRHPACKAGALPAELRPLITFVSKGSGGPGRT